MRFLLTLPLLLSLFLTGCSPAGGTGSQDERDLSACPDAPSSTSWLVGRFFATDGFDDRTGYYTGEMLKIYRDAPTLGSYLTVEVRIEHRPVLIGCLRSVYATALSTERYAEDWYLHLAREEQGWKIEAVRKLALPGVFFSVMDALEADPNSVDRVAEVLGEGAPVPSGTERLANMRLSVSTDAALKEYFERHTDALVELVAGLEQDLLLRSVTADGRAQPGEVHAGLIAEQLRSLSLNAVLRRKEHPGCLFVSIGGILDNEVGYLYSTSTSGCSVPEMSPSDYILIERLAPNWFLYKTT